MKLLIKLPARRGESAPVTPTNMAPAPIRSIPISLDAPSASVASRPGMSSRYSQKSKSKPPPMHFSGAAYTPKRKKKVQYFRPKSKTKSSPSPKKVSPGPASPGAPANPPSPDNIPGYAKPQQRNYSRPTSASAVPNHRPDLDACLSWGAAVDERGKRQKQKAERRAHARTLRMRDGRANSRTAGAAAGSPNRPGTAPATYGGGSGARAAGPVGGVGSAAVGMAVPSVSTNKEFVPIVGQTLSPSTRPSSAGAGGRGGRSKGGAVAVARTGVMKEVTGVAAMPPPLQTPSPVTYIPTSGSPLRESNGRVTPDKLLSETNGGRASPARLFPSGTSPATTHVWRDARPSPDETAAAPATDESAREGARLFSPTRPDTRSFFRHFGQLSESDVDRVAQFLRPEDRYRLLRTSKRNHTAMVQVEITERVADLEALRAKELAVMSQEDLDNLPSRLVGRLDLDAVEEMLFASR